MMTLDQRVAYVTAELGALVRETRLDRGMTQIDLADAVEMSQRWISDVERGHTQLPRPDKLKKLSEALHRDLIDFYIAAGVATDSPLVARLIADAEPPERPIPDRLHDAFQIAARLSPRQQHQIAGYIDALAELENEPAKD